jgi:transcriptional regulator with XRE-family HTH domain
MLGVVNLGQRIRRSRLAAGLTIRELAARIGSSETTVRNWEGDHSTPRPDLAALLERELGNLGLNPGPPALASVDDPEPATRGRRRSNSPRLDEASVQRLLAELGSRDVDHQDELRALRARVTQLTEELERYRPGRDGVIRLGRNVAARTRDNGNDNGTDNGGGGSSSGGDADRDSP